MKQVSIFKGVVSLEKVLAFCLIFIYLVGCAQTDPNTKGPSNENSNEQISISIQEDTLTNKGATIELKNESEEAVIFTSYYVIEKEKTETGKSCLTSLKNRSSVGKISLILLGESMKK